MVTFSELRAAQEYLDKKKVLLPTKLIRSIELEKKVPRNLQIYLKPENLQRTGSYKVRGAFNKMRSLQGEEIQRGVITASSGNHAQGVAYAAKALGIQCRIVMPRTAPKAKKMATADYGVEVLERGESYDEAYEAAKKLADESKETFVEAFDDLAVIAGHGTVGLEIAEELPRALVDVGMVLVPAGGGALVAGTSLAMERLHPNAQVIALQSEENQALVRSIERYRNDSSAVDPYRDESTKPSIADGTRISGPGELPWRLLKERSHIRGVAVSESEIQRAIFFLFEKCRLLVEGAGALGVAALLSGRVEPLSNSTVVVILSGGNIDITKVASVIESQLTAEDRYCTFSIEVEDAPGCLNGALAHFANLKVNIVDLRRVRAPVGLSHAKARLEVVIEANNRDDADSIFRKLAGIASREHTFEIRELLR